MVPSLRTFGSDHLESVLSAGFRVSEDTKAFRQLLGLLLGLQRTKGPRAGSPCMREC